MEGHAARSEIPRTVDIPESAFAQTHAGGRSQGLVDPFVYVEGIDIDAAVPAGLHLDLGGAGTLECDFSFHRAPPHGYHRMLMRAPFTPRSRPVASEDSWNNSADNRSSGRKKHCS